MKKKKLTFVISDLEIGGAQRVLVCLANYFLNKGFNIKILVFKFSNKKIFNLSKNIKIKNLSVYGESKNIFQKIISNINRIIKLRIEIKKNQSNVIISFLTTSNILTLISAIGLRKKIIVNERNDITKKKLNYSWKLLRIIFYRFAKKIIVNTPNIKKKIYFFSSKKIIFIPNPTTFTFSSKKIKKQKIILSIARLTYQKNIEILIKSFSKSIALKKKWKLVIIGEGEEKKKLLKLAKKINVFKSIIFMGVIKKIDIWYKKAGIFILPSRYEGMPNVIIEAMQSKTAIIGSNIPGIRYFIKNRSNGVIFKNNNENSLIKMINLLINNSDLRKNLAKNGKKSISKYNKSNNFFKIWERQLKKI